MTVTIFDHAEEFRIEISGHFSGPAVSSAASAWQSALSVNTPRRISVDITRMASYNRAGWLLLREIYSHGTHMAAGNPQALLHLTNISSGKTFKIPKVDKGAERPLVPPQTVAAAASK